MRILKVRCKIVLKRDLHKSQMVEDILGNLKEEIKSGALMIENVKYMVFDQIQVNKPTKWKQYKNKKNITFK